jgi:heme oxygenase
MLNKFLPIKNTISKFSIFKSLTLLKSFCNIHRLNMDKLNIDKVTDSKVFEQNNQKPFDINKSVIEFNPEVSWEQTVLKSELPVVVDVYAK